MATIRRIAEITGAQPGGAETEIAGVSSPGTAQSNSLVFAMDLPTLMDALASNAGAILARRNDFEKSGQHDSRVLLVSDPRYAFSLVARFFFDGRQEGKVHETAVIGSGVKIGSGTDVGPYAVLGDGVSIGENCTLLSHVVVHSETTIGDRVVVQAGSILGATGFGYARSADTGEYIRFPQQGTLTIADDVEIGANTTIDRGALGETRIGRGTKIDNLVHIAHNCVIGANVIIAAQTGISGSSIVEDGAILGGQVGIGEHALVGPGVILGGGAGVLSGKKMRGPGQVFWGRPARPLKEYLRDLARLSRR